MCVYIMKTAKSFLMINRYNTILMENNMSDTMHDGILDNIESIDKYRYTFRYSIEFERVLDEAGLYAYKNLESW